ncbi:FtsZ/tubulin family protein [Natronorubrum daqingense]|uniref:Tubulin-like protein CetZ n=1 Tax=Natronorubrum daqingense TaxID=588898 RepID=A0A1N7F1T1_9EURY|nr:cell division protein FtsZ [Natronorubrum daqingense]APX97479.1 cell division protein FtsZ [Natronorubrum daqingense]SIR94343.1 Cell division GTPase FtsZ [Natronorubrum daqingense]
MQLEVIGVGGAGCRLADAIRAAEPANHAFLTDVYAFDTDEAALGRTVIPESNRHRYGEGDPAQGATDGGDGDGSSPIERGFERGQERADELLEVLGRGEPSAADAFLVTVGLGGTTGGGTVPALVATLQRTSEQPVYVLATLPADREFDASAGETDGLAGHARTATATSDTEPPRPEAATNALATLERLEGVASAIVLFDNEAWLRPGETLSDARDRSNREVATQVAAVFSGSAGESGETTAQTVIDASDVERIVGSESAFVTLGYAEQAVETTSSRFGLGLLTTERDVDTAEAVSAVETVVRKAIRGKRSLECDPEAADRGLLIVGGPPAWLNRKAIADGRRTLQTAIDGSGILGGDAPRPDGETVFAGVVLAGIGPVERLEELRETAGTR